MCLNAISRETLWSVKLNNDVYQLRVCIFRFLIPVVFYANVGGLVRQKTTVVGSYFIG